MAKKQTKPTGSESTKVGRWGKLLAVILPVIGAALAWHLTTCLPERTRQATEFRDTILAIRLSDEKATKDLATLAHLLDALVEDIKNGRPSISEVEKRNNQIESLGQIANADCNAAKETYYKYINNRTAVIRYFRLPKMVWKDPEDEGLGRCSALLEIGQGVYSPKPTKLINDADYRRRFIEAQQPYLAKYDKQIELVTQGQRVRDQNNEKLLALIEGRNNNMATNVWDCLCLLFSSK